MFSGGRKAVVWTAISLHVLNSMTWSMRSKMSRHLLLRPCDAKIPVSLGVGLAEPPKFACPHPSGKTKTCLNLLHIVFEKTALSIVAVFWSQHQSNITRIVFRYLYRADLPHIASNASAYSPENKNNPSHTLAYPCDIVNTRSFWSAVRRLTDRLASR